MGARTLEQRFLDVKAAFPSISHEWIFAVLEAAQFPPWCVRAVRGLCAGIRIRVRFRGCQDQCFELLRGVKQGCPLMSGVIFAVATDCINMCVLNCLKHDLSDLLVFADDQGAVA
eukprot:103081-Pyramimonas_sp.AAC.1